MPHTRHKTQGILTELHAFPKIPCMHETGIAERYMAQDSFPMNMVALSITSGRSGLICLKLGGRVGFIPEKNFNFQFRWGLAVVHLATPPRNQASLTPLMVHPLRRQPPVGLEIGPLRPTILLFHENGEAHLERGRGAEAKRRTWLVLLVWCTCAFLACRSHKTKFEVSTTPPNSDPPKHPSTPVGVGLPLSRAPHLHSAHRGDSPYLRALSNVHCVGNCC